MDMETWFAPAIEMGRLVRQYRIAQDTQCAEDDAQGNAHQQGQSGHRDGGAESAQQTGEVVAGEQHAGAGGLSYRRKYHDGPSFPAV